MRKHLAVLAAAACLAGCGSADTVEPEPTVDFVADASIPEYQLLNDALQIEFDRRTGQSDAYALVPANRPPRLLGMVPAGSNGDDGSSVVDYRFGEQRLNAIVELSRTATDTCEMIKADASGFCVRDDVASDWHITVYFTGDVETSPKAGDPETDEAAAFWTKTAMVPIADAAWVTELITRGKAAAEK